MSLIKKLNKKWADSSILEKIIKILACIVFLLIVFWALWDDIDFYCLKPSFIVIPVSLALVAGIGIYFFAIYLSPPKRRIAGFIWWGTGNLCLLFLGGWIAWMSLGIIELLQSPLPEVVKIAKENLYSGLVLSLVPTLIAIVSSHFLLTKYKKSKKNCIPTKNVSAVDDD